MPRFVVGKTKLTTKEKNLRASRFNPKARGDWIDPFPMAFGTVPEKIVYQALSRRNIPFYYLNDVEINIPEIELLKFFQADFVIPSMRLIIEVQGAFWHSKEKTIEADALKFAYYEQMGFRVLAWWDFDIISNVNALFRNDPQLAMYGVNLQQNAPTELAAVRRTKTDSSKGIRTLNRKRGQRLQYRKKAGNVKTRRSKNFGQFTSIT